jgi:cysteine desulfurase family protein (TIGR01976 family)
MLLTQDRIEQLRSQFPALSRIHAGKPIAFFDGPAGTQVPKTVIDAISHYLSTCNANHGGLFATSIESDALLDEVHAATADFLGVSDPQTVFFGANMTSLTFALSRALARTWKPGDEVIVTRLDHDANVRPWVLAARDAGAVLKFAPINKSDCTLDLPALKSLLTSKTRLVAVGAASNSVGTINPLREIADAAHGVGALMFVDAVHYAPHGRVDVGAWGCDFLACSAYKFFGPHIGIMWGRRELLLEIEPYKLRPASNDLPGRWMTGTQNHECLTGVLAAINYVASLGEENSKATSTRRAQLDEAFKQVVAYETSLAKQFMEGAARIPSLTLYGITDLDQLSQRVPTFSLRIKGITSTALATRLADHGIFAWHGNYYALELSEQLGMEPDGMVRVGMVHYNTPSEVDRLLQALADCA